jgi:DNA-binding PadR family transcriptional regulator
MSLTPLKELMVLSTLRAHPMHGYALVDALESGLGWTVGLTRSTVYAILRRFVERGWIDGEAVRDNRYPEREVYRVTSEGEQAHREFLRRCIDKPTEGTHPVAALLAQLDEVENSEQRRAVEAMLAERRRRLLALDAFPEHDGLAGSALELLRLQIRAEVEMLEQVLG